MALEESSSKVDPRMLFGAASFMPCMTWPKFAVNQIPWVVGFANHRRALGQERVEWDKFVLAANGPSLGGPGKDESRCIDLDKSGVLRSKNYLNADSGVWNGSIEVWQTNR